jgi:glycosyltransferase involved in cell wall biosynthesis
LKGQTTRLYRTGLFAQHCAELGHEVVWWTSAFDHFRKRFHVDTSQDVQLDSDYKLRLLKGCGYEKNISFERFRDHALIAKEYTRLCNSEAPPDIILCSVPIIELANEALAYANQKSIPVVLDARDMWPDIFAEALPGPVKSLYPLLFRKQIVHTRDCFQQAAGVLGHTESFVDWGLGYAGRARDQQDRAFAHGYPALSASQFELEEAFEYWTSLGVSPGPPVVAFLGTLSQQFDFEPLVSASQELSDVKFVIAGEGPLKEELQNKTTGFRNVIFPGWIDLPKIQALMQIASLGISPAKPKPDFEATIQNKAIEYMSAGLPILWSLDRGVLAELIREHGTGFIYNPGSQHGLRDTITTALADAQRLETYGINAKALFEARYRADRIYQEMAEHLEKIASGGYHL